MRCLLKLNIIADQLTDIVQDGPEVCQNATSPYPIYCSKPNDANNILQVQRASSIPSSAPTLSLSTNNLSLVTGGLQTITVTNNSTTDTVNNVTADFSGTSLENEIELLTRNPGGENLCTSIAPGGTCTLSLVSYSQVAIPSTNFTISAANSQSVTASASVSYTTPNALYQTLLADQLNTADIWDNTARIMSANYAFEGIQGIPNGEENVINAGGTWNIISNTTPSTCYACFTPAGDTNTQATAFGYTTYYEDALPICFSQPVLPSTVNPSDFRLTLNTGKVVTPDVASLTPNFYFNERSCVVIFGAFGNRIPRNEPGAIYPTTVSIVAGASDGVQGSPINLTLVGPGGVQTSMVGHSYNSLQAADPYSPGGGPGLLAAKISVMNNAGQCTPAAFANLTPNDGVALYGSSHAQYRLRMFTSGGFALGNFTADPNVAISMMANQYNIFFKVKVVDPNGEVTWLYQDNKTYTVNIPGGGTGNITIAGLAGLGKAGTPFNDAYACTNNNYIDIVLYGDKAAMHEITELDIPSTGINPETGQAYLAVYNPGGPGNNPTSGIFYTYGSVEIKQAVTDAIDNANTVSLNPPNCGF